LGRLVEVIENPGGLNYTTTYAYNPLDSLTGVTQGSQSRTFAYDWLGRLTSAANPESGTTTYDYDGNGNLTSRTDALSRVTTMSYDRVDRVYLKSYGDGTPSATYCYDGNVASTTPGVCNTGSGSGYPQRQLTEVSSTASKTGYAYDVLGRTSASTQTTDSTAYNFSYTWNAAGQLASMTYPSTRTLNYCFDSAYQPVGVRTGSGSCTPGTSGVYAGNGTYAPHGPLKQFQFGNNLWETTDYNTRLQPSAIKLGTSAGSNSLFGSALDYGTTANNGNVLSQTIAGLGVTQTYTYDGVNRISSAAESGSGTAWSQTFSYGNQYGNLWRR
jgi:YD repeat-containing protein